MCRLDSPSVSTLVYNSQPGPAKAHCFVVRNVSNNHHERKCHSSHQHHASENIDVKTRKTDSETKIKFNYILNKMSVEIPGFTVSFVLVVRRDKRT